MRLEFGLTLFPSLRPSRQVGHTRSSTNDGREDAPGISMTTNHFILFIIHFLSSCLHDVNVETSSKQTNIYAENVSFHRSTRRWTLVPPRILISSRTSSSEFMRTHRSSSRVSESLQQPIKEPRCVCAQWKEAITGTTKTKSGLKKSVPSLKPTRTIQTFPVGAEPVGRPPLSLNG